jgi:DinB family
MRTVTLLCIVFAVVSLSAQNSTNPKPDASPTVAAVIDKEISNLEGLLVSAAEAMPEDKFNISPENLKLPGAEFKGVRTFADQVKHVAADNFAIWAPLTGKPEPAGVNSPNGPAEMKSRAEIIGFLKDSFVFAHKAAAGMTSENTRDVVEFRRNKVTRLYLIILAFSHANDHYGQIVEYLRMSGVVPPASRPQ